MHGSPLTQDRDRLLDPSTIVATTLLDHREDDVSAVQHSPNVAIPEAFEELPKVRHSDSLRLADIDPAKKRYPSINHRLPLLFGSQRSDPGSKSA